MSAVGRRRKRHLGEILMHLRCQSSFTCSATSDLQSELTSKCIASATSSISSAGLSSGNPNAACSSTSYFSASPLSFSNHTAPRESQQIFSAFTYPGPSVPTKQHSPTDLWSTLLINAEERDELENMCKRPCPIIERKFNGVKSAYSEACIALYKSRGGDSCLG